MTKSIFITGCSSGIGYMAAKQLQLRGYQVIASCRDAQDVARLSQESLTCIQLDLTCEASINQAVEQALELSNHRLYALFNNGAYGQPGALEDLPVQAMREQFEANFFWLASSDDPLASSLSSSRLRTHYSKQLCTWLCRHEIPRCLQCFQVCHRGLDGYLKTGVARVGYSYQFD